MYYVTEASYAGGYRLMIRFEDDETVTVDLSDPLDGPIFEPLKDMPFFKTFRVNHDVDTVVWPNGADRVHRSDWPYGAHRSDRSNRNQRQRWSNWSGRRTNGCGRVHGSNRPNRWCRTFRAFHSSNIWTNRNNSRLY